jgi:hypothetical protein
MVFACSVFQRVVHSEDKRAFSTSMLRVGNSDPLDDGSGVSAQGRRLHEARRRAGTGASALPLAAAEQAWVAAGFPDDQAALDAIVAEAARSHWKSGDQNL